MYKPVLPKMVFALVVPLFSSLSLGSIYCPAGDLNDDCQVDIQDVVVFAEQWLDVGGCSGIDCADLDGSGKVQSDDFAILSGNWSKRIGPAMITEFMASNSDALTDEDGDSSDWIEIYNHSDTTVDLAGWYLTDDKESLMRWRFPAGVSLEPGEFLLVFASGKNRIENLDELHTNFKLDRQGEYLGLVEADGVTIAYEYEPRFPQQYVDVSYGLAESGRLYYTQPTPGSANGAGFVGVAESPRFSLTGRTYLDSFQLELTTVSPDAEIRYTTNGTIPTDESTLYTGPIYIENNQARWIRASRE